LVGWESLSDAIATDADQFGGQYLNRITQLLIGADIAASDSTLAPIIGTKWTFKTGTLFLHDTPGTHTINIVPDTQSVNTVLKTPAQSFTPDYISLRTQSEELQNKVIDGTKNTLLNMALATRLGYDYYIFIDTDDGNKFKCKDGKTGLIVPAATHATNADVPLQYAIDQLSSGSTSNSVSFWSGGKYGTIFVGPGTFTFYTAVILKSNIAIIGSGRWNTKFTFPNGLYPSKNNNTLDIFKSFSWDTASIATGPLIGETGIMLKDFEIYGNWINNVIPAANTATSRLIGGIETAGEDSWGHGIAIWGYNILCENLFVHGCPGAGIILQNNNVQGVMLGGGVGAFPFWTQSYDSNSQFINIRSWLNGRQGLLLRGPASVYNYWSYWNGEAGIDAQTSANFTANVFYIDNIECFGNGANHGTYTTSDVYDPLCFSVRLAGIGWLSNAWIEGPYGRGNTLMIGADGTGGNTGYQIRPGGGVYGNNINLDGSRDSHLFIGPSANACKLRLAVVGSPIAGGTGASNPATPMTVLGNFHQIDLTFTGFIDNVGANYYANGAVLGSASTGLTWSHIKIYSYDNQYVLDNQNAGNLNAINATIVSRGAQVTSLLRPGGAALNTTTNDIIINPVTNTANPIRSHNGGIATFSGNGSNKVFNIAHGLFAAPTVVNVNPNTDDARGPPTITFDATYVIVTYGIAPPSGVAGNVKLLWNARVSP
jgi:hypothetical protein